MTTVNKYGDHDPEGIDGPRAGNTHRITWARMVRADCLHCDYEVANSGAAASHARSRRHVVRVHYSTTFAFVPDERLAETLGGERR